MPTIFDVAEAAGVSIASVSLVLNDPETRRVGSAKRQEILRVAKKIGYTPNLLAKGLGNHGTGIVGLIVPMRDAIFFNPFITEFLSGIQTSLVENHYHLMIYSHDGKRGKITHSQIVQSKAADGMIVINTRLCTKADIRGTIRELDTAAIPFVMINSYCGGEINYVGMDYEAIGRDVGAYLGERGHRKIGFIGGAEASPASPPMLAGFRQSLASQGVELRQRWVTYGEYDPETVRKVTRRLLKLKDRPTAVFCTGDQMVPDIYRVAKEEGLQIPGDLAVVGRGDVNFAALLSPPLPTKAKSIIFLFMHGGASHIDSFDPKPMLQKLHGQLLPPSLAGLQLQFTKANEAPIMGSPFKFQKHGQSGIEVSELFPHVARHVDDLAVIRSCHHDGFTHSLAMNLMLNGSPRLGFPSVGSWAIYGLGSENQNLPAFIVMLDGGIKAGPPAYGSGFLPAVYQGTVMRTKGTPFLNITPPEQITAMQQRDLLDRLKWHNERHLESRADDSNLSARIASYELAFRLQTEAPELADLSKETEATRTLYGIDREKTRDFGLKCLMARRLVERGVRFIQLYSGTSDDNDDWDTHQRNDEGQRDMSLRVDKPLAGLLADLKQRGLLDSTLVVWGGDFGRTPVTDGNLQSGAGANSGRDHNPYGFTMWLAGGGVKGGQIIGATDELGFKAIEDPFHVHDFHATLLELMGLDHTRLTYFFQGRNFRLTDVHGDHPLTKRLLA